MKFKVKGLVFVGFAAAILSANAMAADSTVTSKSYVDSKYIAGTGITVEDGTGADSGKKVISTTADLTPYTASDGIALSQHNFTNAGVRSVATGREQDANGTIAVNTNGTTTAVAVKGLGAAAYQGLAADGVADGDTGLVNADEVYEYVQGQITGANLSQYELVANKLDSTDAISSTTASITDNGTGDTTYPTTKAVYDYVTVKGVKVNNTALTADANKDVNIAIASGNTAGSIAVNGVDVAVTNAEVTGNKADAIITSGDNANITSTTKYTTTKAVYDYVTGLAGSNVPAATGCTADAPCALVATGANTFTWQAIQQ